MNNREEWRERVRDIHAGGMTRWDDIYIYIVHGQIVSFYQNSSVWLDAQDAWSQDRNPFDFTLDLVSDCSANKRITLAKGFIRCYVATAAAVSVCLHFLYSIGYQSAQFFWRALNYASGDQKFLLQSAQWIFFVSQMREKLDTLKWIGPQRDLLVKLSISLQYFLKTVKH